MPHSHPATTVGLRTGSAILAGLVVVIAALLGVVGHTSWGGGSPSVTSPMARTPSLSPTLDRLHTDRDQAPSRSLGIADGAVPDGVTVFDNSYPAVANLDPALLGALRKAATDAAADKVEFVVTSGWRSPRYQEHLLVKAVATYGSRKKAARWVATPSRSAHVSGDAVDIGRSDAQAWLSEHGAEYGLCQTYINEPWHYELRLEATHQGCPTPYADPAHDPRMQ
jgi:D-alanyl-D-alanine carboxypeptidase